MMRKRWKLAFTFPAAGLGFFLSIIGVIRLAYDLTGDKGLAIACGSAWVSLWALGLIGYDQGKRGE